MEYKSIKEEEFNSIYQAHANSILRTAQHYVKDYDTAQEITQQAFFQLYTHLDNVDLEYIQPWLVRTAKNLMLNHIRDLKNEILGDVLETIMESENTVRYTESLEDRYMREEQKKITRELNDSIFEKLYKKNPKWCEAIMMVYCLGKTQEEAAAELGVAVTVLNSRLYRARQWIRKNYEKEYENVVNWF